MAEHYLVVGVRSDFVALRQMVCMYADEALGPSEVAVEAVSIDFCSPVVRSGIGSQRL